MLPILFQSPDLIIYSYPLLMGLGWGVAYQLFFSRQNLPLVQAQVLFWGLFMSAWVGSKTFFLLTTSAADQSSLMLNANFWTGGGFVFYGGLIVASVFLIIFRLFCPISQQTLWAILPALTLGHAIGRFGCMLAGCCFGSITDWWWGVELHGGHRHPTQMIECLGLIALTYWLLKGANTRLKLAVYFCGYGTLRFGVEALRGDSIRGQWGLLTPSQWISIVLIILGTGLLFSHKFRSLQAK